MPVDDEVNLDAPDGISQDDIDRMHSQADELERIADKSEANAEIIRKNMKVFDGKSFKEIDAVTQNANESSGKEISGDAEQRLNEIEERQKEILILLNEAKEGREKNKKKLTELEMKQQEQMQKFNQSSGDISNIWMQGQSLKNPVGMGMQKLKGLAMRAGVYGAIAVFALEMVEKIVDEMVATIKDQFKAGGVFDVRKVVENQVKEYQSLNYLTSIKNGNVIFTGDAGQDMVQGAVRGAFNTRDLRDGHLRHIQIYAGE